MNPLLLLGAGAAALLLLKNKASATEQPYYPEGPAARRDSREMPDALKAQIAESLSRLNVDPTSGRITRPPSADGLRYATATVGQLEAQGYYDAASQLRAYVTAAAPMVPTPAEADAIAKAAPTGLSEADKQRIARTLSLSRDPKEILALLQWLRSLPQSPERDASIGMAEALRLQLLAAQSTSETLQQIDQVIRTPVQPTTATSPGQPTATLPALRNPFPETVPGATRTPGSTLPEQPAYVPPQPQPQPLPRQLSAAGKAAVDMMTHIRSIQSTYGAKGAKGRQDRTLIKRAQAALGQVQDGLPGVGTFVAAAKAGAVDLPWVMYWPKSATAATVLKYRAALEALASKATPVDAQALRASAKREHGESGIVGKLAA